MKKTQFILIFFLYSLNLFSQSLIADFPFSGNPNDISGNNNHGTVHGATLTTDRFGNENSAYYFDGINDYIDLNSALLPTDGSDWSLSTWFQANLITDNKHKVILAQYNYIQNQQNEGRFHIFIYNNELNIFSSANYPSPIIIAPIDNLWNNLVITCSDNILNVYLNCSLIVENIQIDPIYSINTFLGDDGSDIPDRFFKGKIDDVKIYNYVLSEGEINYDCGEEDDCLVADYSFSGNANDISGNNNNGTVYGATLTTDRFGNDNSAYFFDGVNDYIDLNSALLPTNGSDWSIGLWFKSENDNDGDLKNILAQYQWAEGRFHLFEHDNKLKVFSSSMEHGYDLTEMNPDWNYLVTTCSNNSLKIYLNCELIAEGILIDPILNTNTLVGDDGSASPNRFYKGVIDDLTIYNCVLSEDEIYSGCSEEDDCLVADYSFSGNADDISGNNNHGTVHGTTLTTDRFGNENSAYYFDGVNDYINLNSPLLPTDGSDWSFSLWYEADNDDDGDLKDILAQYEWAEGRFHIFEYNKQLKVFSSNMEYGYAIADINDGWNNVIITCSNNLLDIYLNCELVAENILIDPVLYTNTLIGDGGSASPNRFFKGKIDDIKIYSCVLSEEDIISLCEEGGDDCLVADYPFSGNADDVSGNENNGTVFGGHLTSDRFGIENSAYYFHGYHDYIDFNSALLPTDGSDWSASMWYKSDNNHIRKVQNLFSQFDDSLGSFHVFEYYNQLKVFSTSMENAYFISETNNFWNNLVFTCSNNILSVYINNQLIAENILIDNLAVANTMLGFDVLGPKNHFYQGKIDDVKFFHCVLSEEEISDLYFYTQNDIGEKHSVKLYPNPTYSSITVATVNFNNIISEVQIYDINGKLVLSRKINSYLKEVDISELPQAMYLIKIRIGDSFVSKKFFKLTK